MNSASPCGGHKRQGHKTYALWTCALWTYALWTLSCQKSAKVFEYQGFLFGSYVRIKVVASKKEIAQKAMNAAYARMAKLDTLCSIFSKESPISQINLNKSGKITNDLRLIIAKALEVSKKTGGAFDITVFPLMNAFGFYEKNYRVPNEAEIKKILNSVDYNKIVLRNDSVYLNGTEIDLGGIAVGYAVDQGIEVLKKEGVSAGLIDCGGDIKFFGNRIWRIGLKNPRDPESILKRFELKNQAIATAGDYENFFIKDGKRYHHIINPKTGYPSDNWVSVTVITEDAILADAYSTALFVLDKEAGLKFAKDEGLGVIFITEENGKLKEFTVGNR